MKGGFVRSANVIKSGYAYIESVITGKPSEYGMPPFLSVEISNFCNLNCPECLSGSGIMTRERGYMDINLYGKILSEAGLFLYVLNLYFQGEPMMHPEFFTFLNKFGSYRLIVSTNGHFLSPDNADRIVRSDLDRLIISLDGMDQESYSAYRRNGNLQQVINGIRNVSQAKRKYGSDLRLELQFLVNRRNEHQIRDVKRFAREVKASVHLKSMQIMNYDNIETWQPSSFRFRRYFKKDGEYHIKSSLPDRCLRLWFNPVITWDGKVVPCCFDKDAKYIMGDLNKSSLREIWNGPAYRKFRERVLAGRRSIDICRNCTSGLSRLICR